MNHQDGDATLPADAVPASESRMQPVSIPKDIAQRAENFAGRAWVLNEVLDWLDHRSERFLHVSGEPGSGKTALAAWLAGAGPMPEDAEAHKKLERLRSAWRATHFCQTAKKNTSLNPLRFVEALSQQLADRYQDFAVALANMDDQKSVTINATQTVGTAANGSQFKAVVIEALNVGNLSPRIAFDRVVGKPLEKVCTANFNETILILVDALDEALTFGSPNIVTLLAGANDLPACIRFVLTSRIEPKVSDQFPERCNLNLSDPAHADANSGDLRAYLRQRLKDSQLKQPMAAAGSPDQIENLIVKQAAGNFLYLRFLLDEVAAGRRSATTLTGLPKGLYGLYREFLDRLMPKMLEVGSSPQWIQQFQPLLGSLSVAMPAAPDNVLPRWLGRPQGRVSAWLNDIRQLTESDPGDGGGHRLYHGSMGEFLACPRYQEDGGQTDNRYFTPLAEQHERIIRYYLKRFVRNREPWTDCDQYGLRQLVTHMQAHLALAESEKERRESAQALYGVILNEPFRGAQAEKLGSLYTTLADLRTALSIALDRDDLIKALECAGTYRHIKHGLTITSGIWDAVQRGDFTEALQRSRHYEVMPGLLGNWERVLQLDLAWEAAERGDAQAVRQIMGSAEPLPPTEVNWIDSLWDSLLTRAARALERVAAQGRSASEWLSELAPARDAHALLAAHDLAQLDPPGRAALAVELYGQLASFRTLVDEGNPEAISVVPLLDVEAMGTGAASLRRLLVALAATPEGQDGILQALQLVLPNPYPRYRDIGLVALGIACLAVPDPSWVRLQLHRILDAALNQEGVAFAYNLPSVLQEEARKRGLPAPKLNDHLSKALAAHNSWGTKIRAQSAHAAGLFWQGKCSEAFAALEDAGGQDTGYAGYGTLTLLSLANRCYEFGDPDRATRPVWGWGHDISLTDGAAALAARVRDPQFREERVKLVQDSFAAWSKAATPDAETALDSLAGMADPDVRGLYIDHVTARWASAGDDNREAIKKLVHAALPSATSLDTIMARLFGLSLGRLNDAQLAEAVRLCAAYLLVELPRV
jgi:hypothetical protein